MRDGTGGHEMDTALLPSSEVRDRSVAVFGNEKMVEVTLFLQSAKAATAKQIATETGLSYTPVRAVLQRLEAAGVVSVYRDGPSTRAPLHYMPRQCAAWANLVLLAESLIGDPGLSVGGAPAGGAMSDVPSRSAQEMQLSRPEKEVGG
jgi:hypothetical protein